MIGVIRHRRLGHRADSNHQLERDPMEVITPSNVALAVRRRLKNSSNLIPLKLVSAPRDGSINFTLLKGLFQHRVHSNDPANAIGLELCKTFLQINRQYFSFDRSYLEVIAFGQLE